MKENARIKESKKKRKIILSLIASAVVVFVAVFAVINLTKEEDYHSGKYYDDYGWYITTCLDAMSDSVKSKTMLLCDCGYTEFRKIYGSKKVYGELSVADVQGIGQKIKDDVLFSNTSKCYKEEVANYEKEFPNADWDKMWEDGENMVMPSWYVEEREKESSDIKF